MYGAGSRVSHKNKGSIILVILSPFEVTQKSY